MRVDQEFASICFISVKIEGIFILELLLKNLKLFDFDYFGEIKFSKSKKLDEIFTEYGITFNLNTSRRKTLKNRDASFSLNSLSRNPFDSNFHVVTLFWKKKKPASVVVHNVVRKCLGGPPRLSQQAA